MKLSKTVLLLSFLFISPICLANSDSQKEAEKLLNTMGMEQAFEQSIDQMLDIQLQQNPALAPYKGVMQEFFSKHMSYDILKPEMLKIYANAFTANELKEINKFYATDVGKKTIKLMPTLMAQGGQIGAARVQANIDELQTMIKAESERLKSAK
tara:strand:- start:15075 stop:15536 length:462 start_codon:yes stop_codon:yes gene_type:complete